MDEALLQALISGLAVGSAYALVALGFSITFTTTQDAELLARRVRLRRRLRRHERALPGGGQAADVHQLRRLLPGALRATGRAAGGAGVMGLLGWLLYVLGVRPFAGRPGMAWVMSTLGFGVILQSVGLAIWGPKPVVVPGPVGDDGDPRGSASACVRRNC
jgi:branched-chain amino acid transport system permease protein